MNSESMSKSKRIVDVLSDLMDNSGSAVLEFDGNGASCEIELSCIDVKNARFEFKRLTNDAVLNLLHQGAGCTLTASIGSEKVRFPSLCGSKGTESEDHFWLPIPSVFICGERREVFRLLLEGLHDLPVSIYPVNSPVISKSPVPLATGLVKDISYDGCGIKLDAGTGTAICNYDQAVSLEFLVEENPNFPPMRAIPSERNRILDAVDPVLGFQFDNNNKETLRIFGNYVTKLQLLNRAGSRRAA